MTSPLVCISIDDGPDPDNTPRILEILEAEGVTATFFMLGGAISAHTATAIEVRDAGHQIASHGWDHFDFNTLTYQQALNDIDGTNWGLNYYLGVQTNLFRFPYGISSANGLQAVRDLGMCDVLWHWDQSPTNFTGDWVHTNSQSQLTQYVLSNTQDQSILLLHDGLDASGAPANHYNFLRHSIRVLKDDGFKFGKLAVANQGNPVNQYSWVDVVPA